MLEMVTITLMLVFDVVVWEQQSSSLWRLTSLMTMTMTMTMMKRVADWH